MELTIHLHEPHQKQAAFKASKAKRKVIVAGRRGGKTTGVADIAVEAMLDGRRVLEAAPTADQTDAFWRTCRNSLREPIQAGIVYKNESDRVLELPRGGRIRAKTAWNADMLRGDYADLLILDEYSIMNPDTWEEVGAPMLLDNDGAAIFIFTPKRKNHAYRLYQKAKQDTTGRWGHWHFTSHDNPYLSQAALEEITADMGQDAYKQEILAEFLDSEGQVFRNLPACLLAPRDARPEQHPGHTIVIGADWGKQQDRTALSAFCIPCRCEVALEFFGQVDYSLQRGRLAALYERWHAAGVLAESNAMGEPIIEQLVREGLNVVPFATTASSKPPLIESLALSFERAEAQWLDVALATSELESYERTVSPLTNRSSYSAPPGLHDDTVMARALAWRAAGLPQLPAEGTYLYEERVEISPI